MRVPEHPCTRHLAVLAVAYVAYVATACGDDRRRAPPAPSRSPSPAERVVPPCRFEASLAGARVASHGAAGPWVFGQAVFEYMSPSPKEGTRHVNRDDTGGASSVGWRGEALTFELPPNTSLPRDSLLRHGPPPAIAYRADASAPHHIAVVACPTDRASPRLDLTLLRRNGTAEPISAAPVASLLLGGAGPHPAQTHLWDARPDGRITHTLDLPLEVGDVLRLTAGPGADAAGTLEIAFDLAITPRP